MELDVHQAGKTCRLNISGQSGDRRRIENAVADLPQRAATFGDEDREIAAALGHEHHAPRLRQPLGDGDLDRPHETGVDHQRAVRQWRRRPVDRRRRRSLSTARGRWLLRGHRCRHEQQPADTQDRVAHRGLHRAVIHQPSSGGAPPILATSSCRTRSTLKRLAAAIILSMTSSKSNSVDFENRIGLTRAMTNGLR